MCVFNNEIKSLHNCFFTTQLPQTHCCYHRSSSSYSADSIKYAYKLNFCACCIIDITDSKGFRVASNLLLNEKDNNSIINSHNVTFMTFNP